MQTQILRIATIYVQIFTSAAATPARITQLASTKWTRTPALVNLATREHNVKQVSFMITSSKACQMEYACF